MDREKLLRIRAQCKRFFVYMKFMALIVLAFLYLQNQFFESDVSSSLLVPKINAVAGISQILLFAVFIYFEEGSLAALKFNVETHIFADMRTTMKMALPPFFLFLSNQLLLLSWRFLPSQSLSAANYLICGVSFFSALMLKRKFFLTQALAVFFVAKGLDQIPSDRIVFDLQDTSEANSLYGQVAIVLAILCYGLSYVTLEKVLKSSEVSLWIRGIQLNLFAVPLSLALIFINDFNNEDSSGFFDNFNVIAWFFIIFKIAQQMMELFVIKVADSIYRSLSLSVALVIIGIIKYPFNIEDSYEISPMRLATGLALAGICLYAIMDNYPLSWLQPEVEDEQTYRELPIDFNETLSKGYQTVPTVSSSVSNAAVLLKIIDEPAGET